MDDNSQPGDQLGLKQAKPHSEAKNPPSPKSQPIDRHVSISKEVADGEVSIEQSQETQTEDIPEELSEPVTEIEKAIKEDPSNIDKPVDDRFVEDKPIDDKPKVVKEEGTEVNPATTTVGSKVKEESNSQPVDKDVNTSGKRGDLSQQPSHSDTSKHHNKPQRAYAPGELDEFHQSYQRNDETGPDFAEHGARYSRDYNQKVYYPEGDSRGGVAGGSQQPAENYRQHPDTPNSIESLESSRDNGYYGAQQGPAPTSDDSEQFDGDNALSRQFRTAQRLKNSKNRTWACDRCYLLKIKCDSGKPKCGSCSRHGQECNYEGKARIRAAMERKKKRNKKAEAPNPAKGIYYRDDLMPYHHMPHPYGPYPPQPRFYGDHPYRYGYAPPHIGRIPPRTDEPYSPHGRHPADYPDERPVMEGGGYGSKDVHGGMEDPRYGEVSGPGGSRPPSSDVYSNYPNYYSNSGYYNRRPNSRYQDNVYSEPQGRPYPPSTDEYPVERKSYEPMHPPSNYYAPQDPQLMAQDYPPNVRGRTGERPKNPPGNHANPPYHPPYGK